MSYLLLSKATYSWMVISSRVNVELNTIGFTVIFKSIGTYEIVVVVVVVVLIVDVLNIDVKVVEIVVVLVVLDVNLVVVDELIAELILAVVDETS